MKSAKHDTSQALADFARHLARLSDRARDRLTVEDDDKLFTPADLLPLCRAEGLPLVYDVHHHRCHADGLSVEVKAKEAAVLQLQRALSRRGARCGRILETS